MRRGLLSWSHDEVAPEVFRQRQAQLLAGMAGAGLDAMLIYTDFTRPAAVSRLTHFIPYWGQSVLLVARDGAITLVTNLSNRVSGWMRSVSTLEEIVCGPAIGTALAERLPAGDALRVAVVELARFPGGIIAQLADKRDAVTLVEGTALFEDIFKDQAAPPLVLERLVRIAEDGLNAAVAQASSKDANQVIAELERSCRLAGAEEVLIALAPDMEADHRLRRIEGGAELGATFAIQLSLAYKGYWLRQGRTVSTGGSLSWIAEMDRWFAHLIATPDLMQQPAREITRGLGRLQSCELDFWRIEGAWGGTPLAPLAGSGTEAASRSLADISTLSARIHHPRGWWFAAAPIHRIG